MQRVGYVLPCLLMIRMTSAAISGKAPTSDWLQVRNAASEAAAAALEVLRPGSLSRGAHVELTLRHSFHMLGSCCMHLPAVQHYMMALVYRYRLLHLLFYS